MNEFEVTCVNKPDRMSAHEHITHIGNTAGNWRMAREEAIRPGAEPTGVLEEDAHADAT
jgi:hypothetical protein